MNWFDYLAISIIILSGLLGYYKGLHEVIISFISFIVSFIVSVALSVKVSTWLFLSTSIGTSISKSVSSFLFNNPFSSNTIQHSELLQIDIQSSFIFTTISSLSSMDFSTLEANQLYAFLIIMVCVVLLLLVALNVMISLIIDLIIDKRHNNKKIMPISLRLRFSGLLFNVTVSAIVIISFIKLKLVDLFLYINEGLYKDIVASQISNLFKNIF